MAYFGNTPLQSTYLTDYFSGNGSTVAFTLARAPIASSSIIVTISGVKQAASTYGVSGTTLTFSEAPPTGANNIEVLHLGISPETVTLPSYRTVTEFTATAGQTSFSPASYTAGYIDVYRNGVKLGAADFTATNGTTVVLASACTAGDLVRCEGFLITSFNDAIPNTAGAVGDSLIAGVSASKVSGALTSGNMPAGFSDLRCIATTTSSFTMTTLATYYKGTWNSELVDNYNEFDTSNSRFVASETGLYEITIHTTARLNNTGDVYQNKLYKNGSAVAGAAVYEQGMSDSNAQCNLMYTSVLPLNATDYIEQYVAWTGSGSSRTANHYTALCFWIVRKVG